MGYMYKKAVALTVGQLMDISIFGQTSGRLTKECLQNINLMIDNQLFLEHVSDCYLLVNQ